MGVVNQDGLLGVARLNSGGLLIDSPLQAGCTLLSIDHRPCKTWDFQYALDHLRNAEGADIHLVAENPKEHANYV
jgi:hypothetical protein